MNNIAIILAGGSGTRAGFDIPKQFLKIKGRYVIEYSIEAFQQNGNICEIAIVYNSQYKELYEELLEENSWEKVRKLIPGGKERQESSLAAIKAYANENNANLIFHDAARPLISQEIINNIIEKLQSAKAVSTAMPVTDTIIEAKGEYMNRTLDRSMLRQMQTPQGFNITTISEAYKLAATDPNFTATDDCGVVSKYLPNIKIALVGGSSRNMKLTYKEDADMLEFLLRHE